MEQLNEEIFKDSSYYSNTIISSNTTDLSLGLTVKSDPMLPGFFAGEPVNKSVLNIPLDPQLFAQPIINESGNTTLNGNDEDNFYPGFLGLRLVLQLQPMEVFTI